MANRLGMGNTTRFKPFDDFIGDCLINRTGMALYLNTKFFGKHFNDRRIGDA
jgi:hypothetical protein